MNKTIYKLILGGLIGLIPMLSFAQENVITGKVVDGLSGEEIPGATVMIQGTSVGAITDIEGNYSIKGQSEMDVLVFSFIGYLDEIVSVGGRSVIDITLEESSTQLDEIVVVGYGTQRKKVVTGAIASVSAEEISSLPVLRIEQALQGRTPGVQVTNLSGQPGDPVTVKIRGSGSTGNADPLYVVDGMPLGDIDFLNPGDIESMDVLKDAASAAIYGARAANGVVLITTKSGTKGRMNITYDVYQGIQNVGNKVDVLNADEYRMIMNESAINAGASSLPYDLNEVAPHDTDWQDALFTKNAPIKSHQISIGGQSEKSSFASSISYFSQEGIIGGDKSKFERYTARVNAKHKVNKMLSFGSSLNYAHLLKRGISSNTSDNGAFSSALNLDPLTPVVETDEDELSLPKYTDVPVVYNEHGEVYSYTDEIVGEIVNPLALLETIDKDERQDKLIGNVNMEFEPIKNLKFRSSLGTELIFIGTDTYTPLFYLSSTFKNTGDTRVSKDFAKTFVWQIENTVTYSKKINDHNVSLLLGTSALAGQWENLTGSNSKARLVDGQSYLDLAIDTLDQVGGGASEWRLASYFARLSYDFKDKYSFTGIVRYDGSGKFGSNTRFAAFSSVGLAWVMSDEVFLRDISFLNLLKLRLSYGINGSASLDDYKFASTLNSGRGYGFGNGLSVGTSPEYLANNDLRWEESEQLSFGLDFGFFSNRLTGSLDFYEKNTNGLLETVPIPSHVGVNAPEQNVGNVSNSGVEIAVNWRGSKGELNYSFGVNGSFNENKMTNIANPEGILSGVSWARAGTVTRAEEGLPIGFFWGWKTDGIFQTENDVNAHIAKAGENAGTALQPLAVPGDVRFVDTDNDGDLDDDDRVMIGSPIPDWNFGINLGLDYKGFDFSVLMTGALGNELLNGSQRNDLQGTNMSTKVLDRWTGEGTSNSQPRVTLSDVNRNNRFSDLFLEDGSYMRLKNVQLGYNLPMAVVDRIGATKVRVYISGENVLIFTKYTGADPEIGSALTGDGKQYANVFNTGIDRGVYPQARTFRVGASITF